MSKYVWSKIPKAIKYIATDADGYGYGYYKKPRINKDSNGWLAKERDTAYFMIMPKNNPAVDYFNGWHWTRTLEQRPDD